MKKLSILILFISTFNALTNAQENGFRHNNINHTFAKTYDPRSDSVDILNYKINLVITDFANKKLSGNTIVKFNPKVNAVHYLRLDLLALIVDSVKLGNAKLPYHYNDTLININLQQNYSTADTLSVQVFYRGAPQIDVTSWGGFYFQAGYAYNLGVGFGADPHVFGRVWFPCFDNFMERSTYEFNITTNNGKIAYCNGELKNDVVDINNNRTRTWVLDKEIPTYLASVAIGSYTDLKMNYAGEQRNIPILIAAIPSDTTKVKASLIHLDDAMRAYEKYYGPYAWNRVGYALVPFNQGAMEHATNIAFPVSFLNTGALTYEETAAHELSHHWFGDYITCSSQEEMWINEGWASFSEYLFREEVYGKTAYINGIKTLHENLLHFLRYKEGDLNLNNIPHQYTYGDHVYLKGAIMAHNLRGYLGDSLFRITLRSALQANAFKSITNEQFEASLSQASGMDLSHFFRDWIYQTGWGHFSIDSVNVSRFNTQYKVRVFVRQLKYGNPNFYSNVPMDISFLNNTFNADTRKIILNGEYTEAEFVLPYNPSLVVLNMYDRIAQAISSDQKILKAVGNTNYVLAKMNVTVTSISDSTLLRIEHHYTGPKGNFDNNINRMSPQRYWTVSGIASGQFKANAKFNYDGRVGVFNGNAYLDNQLSITNEDSLILLYRINSSAPWKEYSYYTKNTLSSKTDKIGNIIIDSLMMGDYCLGMGTSMKLGISNDLKLDHRLLNIFPNPAKKNIFIELKGIDASEISNCIVYNQEGKEILQIDLFSNQNNIDVSKLNPGTYILKVILSSNKTISKTFIIHR